MGQAPFGTFRPLPPPAEEKSRARSARQLFVAPCLGLAKASLPEAHDNLRYCGCTLTIGVKLRFLSLEDCPAGELWAIHLFLVSLYSWESPFSVLRSSLKSFQYNIGWRSVRLRRNGRDLQEMGYRIASETYQATDTLAPQEITSAS